VFAIAAPTTAALALFSVVGNQTLDRLQQHLATMEQRTS
jgi:hypothetical protein